MSLSIAGLILAVWGAVCGLGLFVFSGISLWEKQGRAARVALGLAAVSAAALGAAAVWLPENAQWALLVVMSLVLLGMGAAFILPIGRVERPAEQPYRRIDERDIMFARARLRPGSEPYQWYYSQHPDASERDNRFRANPGLLSPEAPFYHPLMFAACDASFFLTENLANAVDGPVAEKKFEMPAQDWTRFVKDLARYYGGLEVGVTELRPEHVYSHIGRGAGTYGEALDVPHRYAIAFTVEMDHAMIAPAPRATAVAESARQYGRVGMTAVQLAAVIRRLGYPARAHIDGNYRVVCPLVARDAGLGEIGRMGLLMTPGLGPRVRLGVVTTDLPLALAPRCVDGSVIDFCRICKKCAENCPAQAIPMQDRVEIDGALRWQIDSERCFHYWTKVGTDCARCMTVCPYSHPNNPAHNLVRWGIQHSGAFRRAAIRLDDLFYGRKPKAGPAPAWTRLDGK